MRHLALFSRRSVAKCVSVNSQRLCLTNNAYAGIYVWSLLSENEIVEDEGNTAATRTLRVEGEWEWWEKEGKGKQDALAVVNARGERRLGM